MKALCIVAVTMVTMSAVAAQERVGPLRIEINEAMTDPLRIAIAPFITANLQAQDSAERIRSVIVANLNGTGLFRVLPESRYVDLPDIDAQIDYAGWKTTEAEALVGAQLDVIGSRIRVRFRLFDVFAEEALGGGLEIAGDRDDWRRVAHKVSDVIYSRISGESGYFDSQIAFISETGPKDGRSKQLGLMDHDGENLRFLTRRSELGIVINPRFSPDGQRLIYTSYENNRPNVYEMDVASQQQRLLLSPDVMAFSPRFSPDGSRALMSIADGSNIDIVEIDLLSGQRRALTTDAAIDTSGSYSPDGQWITFESDRSGSQQIFVKRLSSGEVRRISRGSGQYGTPSWSPRGDLIAFTKQHEGRFHIGVIAPDGRGERLLTSSFLDEGPTWSPNGRVLMFFRETPGARGGPILMSVDVNGRNLRPIRTPAFASDPTWSPLRR